MVAWLAGVSVRQAGSGCCAPPCIVAAVLEPRRVHLYATSPGGETGASPEREAGCGRAKFLSSFGVCGHDISAVVLHPRHDLVYTVGADHCLRCWNIKTRAQRWSWEDKSLDHDLIGLLTVHEPPKAGGTGAAIWRRRRTYWRMSAEPRLFVVDDFIWVAGPRKVQAFERRAGQPLWDVTFGEDHDASMCLVHARVLVTIQEPAPLAEVDRPPENDGCLELVAYAADRPKRLELWRQPLQQGAGVHWLCAHGGRLHYVSRKGDEQQLVARSIATGIELWHRPHLVAKHGARVSKLEANAGLLFVFSGVVVNALSVADGKHRWSLELGTEIDANRYFICTRCIAVWLPPDPGRRTERGAKNRIDARQRRRPVTKKQRKMEEETRARVAAAVEELGDSERIERPPAGSRVFVSDGVSVHAVDAHTGERLLDWGTDGSGKMKLGSGVSGQPPASLTCIDGGAAGSSDLFVLHRRVHHTTAGRHVATSLELRSPESGVLRWSEGGSRAAGSVALHRGPGSGGVVGSTILPRIGESETGHRTLHVFNGSTGDLRAVHRVPHTPHAGNGGIGSRPPRESDLWTLVPGGVLILQKRTKSLVSVGPVVVADKLGAVGFAQRIKGGTVEPEPEPEPEPKPNAVSLPTVELDADLELETGAPETSPHQPTSKPSKTDTQKHSREAPGDVRQDRLEFLAHKRRRRQNSKLMKGHNVTTVSDARLEMTAAAAKAAAEEVPKWVWSEAAGKNIEAWTIHGGEVYVLTHDSVVHVLSVSSGKEKRSYRCGDNVPGRRGMSVLGGKAVLVHGARLMLRGVSGCEGRMFNAKKGKEIWRPGLANATKTAGEVAVLGSKVTISLSIDEIDPRKHKPLGGKLFAKSAKHGGLMWRMSFPVPVLESGSTSSIVTIWPMRVDPVETAAMRTCSISEQQTVNFLRLASAMRLDNSGKYMFLTTRYVTHEARGGESRYHIRCFGTVRSIRKKEKGGPWEFDISAMSPGGAKSSGESWHYPPGLPHEGLHTAIQCLEVSQKALVVGCESGHIYTVNPKSGQLMATVDHLHLEEVTSLASPGSGLLWTASCQVVVMRLQPLEQYGVVAAIEQVDMPSKAARVSKLYLTRFEFWAHVFMLLIETMQLLRFAFLARVECKDSSVWESSVNGLRCGNYTARSLCTRNGEAGDGWDIESWGSFIDDKDERGVAPTEVCCACRGSASFLFDSLDIPGLQPMQPSAEDVFGAANETDPLIHLPPAFARVLAAMHVEGFGLDSSQRAAFVWLFWGCVAAVLLLIGVILLSEPLKTQVFFYPKAKRYMLLLTCLVLYAQFLTQLAFIPVFKTLLRSLDCSQVEGFTVLKGDSPLDSPWRWDINPLLQERETALHVDPSAGHDGSRLSDSGGFPWSADPLSTLDNAGPVDDVKLWQECWVGEHRVVAAVGLLVMLLYVPLTLRVLRVGGDITLLSVTFKQICAGAVGYGWCCRRKKLWSEDDIFDLPHRQPFSMQNSRHRLLLVNVKVLGMCLWTFVGHSHPKVASALMMIGAILLLRLSLSRGTNAPYFGERANQLRAALDTTMVLSYAGALSALVLHELSRGTIGINGGPTGSLQLQVGNYIFGGKPGEYWPLGGMVSGMLSEYLPFAFLPAAVIGWGLRPCLHGWADCCCGRGGTTGRSCCGRRAQRRVLPQLDEDEAQTRKKAKARDALLALEEAASLGETEAPQVVDGAKVWMRHATLENAAASATIIQRRARGVAVRRQAALAKAAGPRGAAVGPLLIKDKGAPSKNALDAPLHTVEHEFEGGARGDEALHASALKYGGRFALVLPTWDWHRGLLKLPPPLRGGQRAIEERKMLEVARKYDPLFGWVPTRDLEAEAREKAEAEAEEARVAAEEAEAAAAEQAEEEQRKAQEKEMKKAEKKKRKENDKKRAKEESKQKQKRKGDKKGIRANKTSR